MVLGRTGRLYRLLIHRLFLLAKYCKARAGRGYTNEKNEALCGSFYTLWPYCLEFAHAGYDWTDEIDIEDREYVDDVKCHRDS